MRVCSAIGQRLAVVDGAHLLLSSNPVLKRVLNTRTSASRRLLAAAAGANTNGLPNLELGELTYRPNVGVCIVNSQGLVWAGQRCDDDAGTWQMPQGGVDAGEEPHEAALREIVEETSISSARLVGELDRWLQYDFPTKVRQKLHGGWLQYKGQKQKWFLAHFYGDDSEINLETEHQEFKAWRWMKLEDLPSTVVAFKRDVYVEVAQQFGPLIEQRRHEWRNGYSQTNGK